MISVTLSIGSNCGNRTSMVSEALQWLKQILIDVKWSEIYETPCALKEGKPYMNAVVEGVYQGTGFELQDLLKEKEKSMGRSLQSREKGDVPIDIDIVVCDGEILKKWDYRQKFFTIGYNQLREAPQADIG